jgi:DNA-binding HxlR family transcriptional regulator
VASRSARASVGGGQLRSPCPIAGALDLVGDRWTLLVMRDLLFYDKRRFADFLGSPEGIATNILAERLERLERCGLIQRRRYREHPPREEYHPTGRGRDLEPVLRELIRWGKRHVPGTAKRPPADMIRSKDAANEKDSSTLGGVGARRPRRAVSDAVGQVKNAQPIVTHSTKTRFLHVANGTCTTQLIQAAGIPGALSIWADPLYDGPVPGGLTDEELLEVRTRYHTGPADITFAAWGGSDPSLDPVNDMRQWRATIERHDSYDELILWFEHDLFDQLSLVQLLTWIRERLPTTSPVSLVCIGSFPGRQDFKGLGELTPDELASLLETRQPLGEPQYALAERVWHAFRQPTPQALDNIRQADTSALPYLAAAVTRFLQEYPWTVDGLSRTERRLLELASGDGIALSAAFRHMHDGETVSYVTDTSLAGLAEELSRSAPPLLTLAPGSAGNDKGLRGTVMLTDTGRAVLARQLDKVATCGIDRWLGGVHLQSGGTLWRWDDTRQSVTKT